MLLSVGALKTNPNSLPNLTTTIKTELTTSKKASDLLAFLTSNTTIYTPSSCEAMLRSAYGSSYTFTTEQLKTITAINNVSVDINSAMNGTLSPEGVPSPLELAAYNTINAAMG